MKKGIIEQEFLVKTIFRFSEINPLTTKVSKVYTKFTKDKIKKNSVGVAFEHSLCTLWLKRTSAQVML